MNSKIKLTEFSRFSGCGAKLGPGLLDKALCQLSQPSYPNILADFHGSEDAGVYKLNDEMALIQTIDFFPPISDNPILFGEIAAANALSDIYAMGGKPISAVSVVCFPEEDLDIDWLRQIMQGGLNKLKEAETALLGGHSVSDKELKFGFCVNGILHPDRVIQNSTPAAGDVLILTKPLGTGTINTALKAAMASDTAIQAAESSMTTLNKKASELLNECTVSAMTDVTGFGLIGHAAEMVQSKAVDFHIESSRLPLLPDVMEYISTGLVPEGTFRNKSFRLPFLKNATDLNLELLDLLFDPQTSGGLLTALPESEARELLPQLKAEGLNAAIIGRVKRGNGGIYVDA